MGSLLVVLTDMEASVNSITHQNRPLIYYVASYILALHAGSSGILIKDMDGADFASVSWL